MNLNIESFDVSVDGGEESEQSEENLDEHAGQDALERGEIPVDLLAKLRETTDEEDEEESEGVLDLVA